MRREKEAAEREKWWVKGEEKRHMIYCLRVMEIASINRRMCQKRRRRPNEKGSLNPTMKKQVIVDLEVTVSLRAESCSLVLGD